MIIYELDKYVYFGPVNENYLPNGEGRFIRVNSFNNPMKQTRIPVFCEGLFENGNIKSGKMWFKDGNYFDGTFLDNLPLKGVINYKKPGHKFEGEFSKGMRTFGTLNYADGVTFDGDFENDQIKLGTMLYIYNRDVTLS